jgi:ABC-2 type transport system ATP-binding protein
MATVLETKNLNKNYGKSRGIIDVNLRVEQGEIFGFIGPNGAGKSTAIRSILGLIFPDSGEVQLFGRDALTEGSDLRKYIGFVPSELNYYEGLTVKEIFEYSASFYTRTTPGLMEEYCQRLHLDLKRKIADLSLGNRKKVAIIQALLHRPDLLILDEPTSGLDPLIQSRFYDILREEQQRGCTIFFSSHTLIIRVSEMDELKKMYMKRFRITLSRGEKSDFSMLSGINQLVLTKRGAEGLFSGDIKMLMKQLLNLPLEDVALEDPSLEEIFMHYYDSKDGDEK